MERIIIVTYRPQTGRREELLGLLAKQHIRGRELGLIGTTPPLLGEGVHGEILYVVKLAAGANVDLLWEDPVFQDIDAQVAVIARMVPIRTLDEASASYMDLASLPILGGPMGGHAFGP
ncbi:MULTISPECIES: hypothetical protein [Luteibacter]|uniref:hypothetical protein n=1 Tax=Luteibacter TaxID=242605 RepID=UPI0012E02C8E|nr:MULTISPECIES: hypothetical protein [unclassified Luteibacter]